MALKEGDVMSQRKVVYVRRSPMFDPDPDPSPSLIVIALCAIGVCLAGSTLVAPDIWRDFLILISPQVAEAEKERQEAWKKTMNTLMVVVGLVALIVLAYVFWKWSSKKKERKRARRSYNKIRRMMLK